jgi:uncharacterized ubiquitin-like protein YukD
MLGYAHRAHIKPSAKENSMSFGFPAYHVQRYTLAVGASADLRQASRAALQSLKWQIRQEKGEQITVSTDINLLSWGERVVLDFSQQGSVLVRSECSLPTQCFDWGKNKANVQKFLTQLEQHVK